MGRDFEPFSERATKRVIPGGGWQSVLGALVMIVGLFALAAMPAPGAAATAMVCLPIAGALLFWGVMLHHLSALEEKLGLLIVGLDLAPAEEVDADVADA